MKDLSVHCCCRRSSTAVQGAGSQSKESSPDMSSGRTESRNASISFSKRESSPGVTFKFGGDDDSISHTPQKTPSRKSTDSSGGDIMELPGEKSFEMSLNQILNKCSETSLDKTSDSREDQKKSDRKKKSTPWYTVSHFPTENLLIIKIAVSNKKCFRQ